MIVTFTDFGCHGPYLGQMVAVLRRQAPSVEVIDLLNDAPATDPKHSAYLLAALARWWPEGTVFLCVVDPGVGSGRRPVALKTGGKWFVGPGNGLFNPVALQNGKPAWFEIVWRPDDLSASFHGRDLFAPVAAAIALGNQQRMISLCEGPDLASWEADLDEIVYIDHYGNAVTGLRYRDAWRERMLWAGGHGIFPARTFSDVNEGKPLWYCNSMGLVEVAVNRGSAAKALGLAIGQPVRWG